MGSFKNETLKNLVKEGLKHLFNIFFFSSNQFSYSPLNSCTGFMSN